MNGQCVRLVRGDFDRRTVYSDDPATIAIDFARAGAERLHIAELIPRWNVLPLAGMILTCTERDGTLAGPDLLTLARVLEMTHLPVQYGGGISSLNDIRQVRETGAAGVILGRSLYDGKLSLEQALALCPVGAPPRWRLSS